MTWTGRGEKIGGVVDGKARGAVRVGGLSSTTVDGAGMGGKAD